MIIKNKKSFKNLLTNKMKYDIIDISKEEERK
nr:MAG TPA: hypothetical protein [Caudoviricetes sp.]